MKSKDIITIIFLAVVVTSVVVLTITTLNYVRLFP